MSADKVLKAKALRQIAISQLSLIIDAAKLAQGDSSELNAFKIRYRSLAKVKTDYEKHHSTLVTLLVLQPDELKIEEKNGLDFAKRCHEVETIFYELFELPLEQNGVLDTTIHHMSTHANSSLGSVREHAILPKIQLPTFKGDVTKFLTFNQTFQTLIHLNRNLNNIEKYNYLLSSLEGPPLDIISDIQVTNENYPIAYNTLIERYDNKRLQAFTHWRAIEECPRLFQENIVSLRNLLDTFSKNLSALQNLKFDVDSWDFILAYMLLDRLDPFTRKLFEQQHASNNVPKYESIRVFLQKQCVALESVPQKTKPIISFSKPNNSKAPRNFDLPLKNKSFLAQQQQPNTCFLCKENHIIFKCPTFSSKSIQQRFDIIKKQRACVNCLATSHTTSRCTSNKRCRFCNQQHHTMLCFKQDCNMSYNPGTHKEQSDNHLNAQSCPPSKGDNQNAEPVAGFSKTSLLGTSFNGHDVLLSTVCIRVKDAYDNWHNLKAILDSGAQSSFITKNCAKKLSLPKFNVAMSLQGLDSMCTTAKLGIHCVISSIYDKDALFECDAIILDKICDDIPAVSFLKQNIDIISHLNLADPTFSEKSKIDMLLGNDVFPYILKDGRIINDPNEPVYLNTIFGWTVMGKISYKPAGKVINTFFTNTVSSYNSLNYTIQKFWQIEEVPTVKSTDPVHDFCENNFLQTTTRADSGKYIVSLPFKITAPDFGDTYTVALRRFLSLENRFSKNEYFHQKYCEVIQNYLDNGYMELVSKPPLSDTQNYFYIAHHAVFKKDSASTPLRVVFDASTCALNKPSLNHVLHTGPKLQNDLVGILLNFRLHKFVFTCDIKQMFRNILVNPDDRIYQRLLWRFSPNDTILHYQINVVTFGVVCSPYLAIRTL